MPWCPPCGYVSRGAILCCDSLLTHLCASCTVLPYWLQIASIVRSAMLTREKHPLYDAFGRPLRKDRNGSLFTMEGQQLPATAQVFDPFGHATHVSGTRV